MRATFLLFIIISSFAWGDEPVRISPPIQQDTNVPFRLFDTENNWTKLALNTITGQLYQVHYSVTEDGFAGTLTINDKDLTPEGSKPIIGRFTLYATPNIYNFILVDQYGLRFFWQAQWSMDPKNRFIKPLPLSD
jgi:hypothetical protein